MFCERKSSPIQQVIQTNNFTACENHSRHPKRLHTAQPFRVLYICAIQLEKRAAQRYNMYESKRQRKTRVIHMQLSWETIQANAVRFSKRWADATNEEAQAQAFEMDFFRVFGIDDPEPVVLPVRGRHGHFSRRQLRDLYRKRQGGRKRPLRTHRQVV
jgi:hypothetical protein